MRKLTRGPAQVGGQGRPAWRHAEALSPPRGNPAHNTVHAQPTAGLRSDALNHLAFDPPSFAFGQTAPDAEPLVVLQRVLQALGPDLAPPADPFRLPGGTALLWKERLRIRLRAQRLVLPTHVIYVFRTDNNLRCGTMTSVK